MTTTNFYIKGIVVFRSMIKSFANGKSSDHIFYFHLRDSSNSTVNIICFNKNANKFKEIIYLNKTYEISFLIIQKRNDMYNTSLNHPFELRTTFKTNIKESSSKNCKQLKREFELKRFIVVVIYQH